MTVQAELRETLRKLRDYGFTMNEVLIGVGSGSAALPRNAKLLTVSVTAERGAEFGLSMKLSHPDRGEFAQGG